MTNRQVHRSHRAKSFASIASLVALMGLSSLGLASTVWGGPPAADAEGAAEAPEESAEGAAADAAEAPDAGLGADPTADAKVIPEESSTPEADLPLADIRDEGAASVPGASSLRARMEATMADIGQLAVEARSDEDLVRAACVLDKQDRANDVMDLGTSELLIIRDPGTSEQARSFALEKLDAASLRMERLLEEAKACAGRQGPEDEIDITRNQADEPRTIPVWAPSSGLGHHPTPPPMDGAWPPAASPIE